MESANSIHLRQPIGIWELFLFNLIIIVVGWFIGVLSYAAAVPAIKATPVWPLAGISLALYFFFRWRAIPAIFLSVLILTYFAADRPLWMCVLMSLGNTIEPMLGVWILRKLYRSDVSLRAFYDTMTLAITAVLTPIPAALIGGILLTDYKKLDFHSSMETIGAWWTGHFTSILIFVPLIFSWIKVPRYSREDWKRFFGLSILLGGVGLFIFYAQMGRYFLFSIFPIMLLSAIWLPGGLKFLLVAAFHIFAFVSSKYGWGIFYSGTSFQNILNLQVFLGTVAIITLALTEFRGRWPFRASTYAILAGWVFSGIVFGLVIAEGLDTDKERVQEIISEVEREIALVEERNFDPQQSDIFFANVFNRHQFELHVEVFAHDDLGAKPIYSSAAQPIRPDRPFEMVTYSTIQGQKFSFGWRRSTYFRSAVDFSGVLLSCCGALLSLFIGGVIYNLEAKGDRARRLVREKSEKLKESEGQYARQAAVLERIMNSVPVGIFRINAEGRILHYNNEWAEILGRKTEKLEATSWLEYFVPEEAEKMLAQMQRANSGTGQVLEELRVLRPDGSLRFVEVILVSESDQEEGNRGFLGTMQDLTEFKAAQEIVERQRAMVVNSAKMASLGEMASGIAHEINNPLTIIHGKVRQMRKYLEKGSLDVPLALSTFDDIESTSLRISKVVKGLRSFSRSSEKDPMLIEDLAVLIGQTLDLCRERFNHEGIELRIGDIPSAQVACRAPMIEQVLMNLLSNAIDAVKEAKERWVAIETTVGERAITVCVSDSGAGIPPYYKEKIFQPFFTTKEVGLGTGLGLSIAQGIMADHHGRLFLDENSAHTRFVMEIPRIRS